MITKIEDRWTRNILLPEDAALRDAISRYACLNDGDLRYLSRTDLHGASLEGVPFIRNIHKVVYKKASKPGALNMCTWHTCETTHCRAGWVVALAGEAGRAMEFRLGTPAAALLIY